jgi:hypothetical protein
MRVRASAVNYPALVIPSEVEESLIQLQVSMPRTFPELPDWSFDADEVSVGVYAAFGRYRNGRTVEVSGLDPEMLIQKCRQAAIELMAQANRKII